METGRSIEERSAGCKDAIEIDSIRSLDFQGSVVGRPVRSICRLGMVVSIRLAHSFHGSRATISNALKRRPIITFLSAPRSAVQISSHQHDPLPIRRVLHRSACCDAHNYRSRGYSGPLLAGSSVRHWSTSPSNIRTCHSLESRISACSPERFFSCFPLWPRCVRDVRYRSAEH